MLSSQQRVTNVWDSNWGKDANEKTRIYYLLGKLWYISVPIFIPLHPLWNSSVHQSTPPRPATSTPQKTLAALHTATRHRNRTDVQVYEGRRDTGTWVVGSLRPDDPIRSCNIRSICNGRCPGGAQSRVLVNDNYGPITICCVRLVDIVPSVLAVSPVMV